MIQLTIDGQAVSVPAGSTILDAAGALGIDVPALCHADGFEPAASCMACVVQVDGRTGLVPSCATPAVDGMVVHSETDAVHAARRSALELLLSDHVGDCQAPCRHICPTDTDIPGMLRHIETGDFARAIQLVREDNALPGVLGYLCNAPCENGCRRAQVDASPSICNLHRFITELDLALDKPHLPQARPASGKKVAVVGAGPAGLSAAWHLHLRGCAVTVFDRNERAGGQLLRVDPTDLPQTVLEREIAVFAQAGIHMALGQPVEQGGVKHLAALQREFDAVLLAPGAIDAQQWQAIGIDSAEVQDMPRGEYRMGQTAVFVTGSARRANMNLSRAVAEGRHAARAIDQWLAEDSADPAAAAFSVRAGKLHRDELAQLTVGVDHYDDLHETTDTDHARAEAAMCLHCDCSAADNCKLRHYAAMYNARTRLPGAARPEMVINRDHPDLTYEPGKCIRCGLCVKIARQAGEPQGLAFIGRGYDLRIGPPRDQTMADALRQAARACAEACPTGALTWEPHRRRASMSTDS